MNQINNSKKIYHAAIYVRLSKEDGDVATAGKRESNSISNQKNLIKNFLKDKKDIVVVSERVDDGYSGSNFERPAFQMMLEDIKKGIVDCVVVKDLSRFGREYIDAGKYIERLFPALGVRFIAVNDHYDSLEGKSQADEIVIPFKNLINDAYCRDISIKIRSHLEVKRKNGEYIGAFTPYGYQKDSDNKNKLVIDVYAADIVKEIYRMKLSGMSQTAIANALNKQGVLSPMEYKHSLGIRIQDNFKTHEQAEWSAMSVKRILENEVYTGTLVQGKRTTPNHKVKKLMKKPETDWVRIEKNHEAIVSEREFALVQRLLGIDTRTSPNEEKVYPLSGLVVCGDCGAMMIKRDVPAGGKVYAYYICSRHAATKACAAHRIPMGKLEETVLELVKIHIENILDMKKIMDFIHEVPFQELDIKELEIRKEAKEKEAVRCRELRDYLYEDFREGIISKEDYKELHDGYTEKRKKAEEAVRSIDQQISEVLESKSDKYHWLDYFAEHQNIQELTRTVAVELIDQILVYDKLDKAGKANEKSATWTWSGGTVHKILENQYYAGDSVHNQFTNDSWAAQRQKMNQKEEWIIIKNTHEALVSRKDFDEVQEKIGHIVKRVNEARKSNGNNVRDFNFFKQKIVCADCGKTMYLYGKTKGNHRRFYCGNNKLHGKCTPHSITDLEVNDYVLRVIRVHINVYVENVDLIRRLNQRQESIKKYDVFNREIKKCRKELEKVAVHRERLFEDYVCRIIDAEQYETFSKQDAETEKEIQNNMEILLKHQVGYEKNFHTEEEWETLINKYRNTRTLTKEMVNAFVEKIEIHESGSITVRLVYDDMLEELRKYAKEREAESCQ